MLLLVSCIVLLLGSFTGFCFAMVWQQNHRHHREVLSKLDIFHEDFNKLESYYLSKQDPFDVYNFGKDKN